MEIDKVYEPQRFEPHWAAWWVESNLFRAEARPGEPYFSLVIPPPNVTGSLHMGHMFEHSIIDAQVRWRRMLGVPTLWLPGTDHAGIATELMVDRQLAKEGIKKRDLGREKFVERVWQWKKEFGGRITEQMKRSGVSCDWSRERFTFDPGFVRAVRETFVQLYEKGLIYRGAYMLNWCPRCGTVLSDLEVEHEETQGNLWHIRYPLNGSSTSLSVATTRPETMLGDTAVAINPKDPRAEELRSATVRLPLMDRDIPIILDDMAELGFGSGAVKITPAHDPNDFEAGKRHNLPSIQVIGKDGRMTPEAGRFANVDRFEARKRVVAALEELGLLEKVEPHALNIGKCHRCKTVVEPMVSTQWWMKMKPLAEPAIKAVEEGRIEFVPANWAKTYFEWMYNIRDWCISRQLWWGHQIPAWHCGTCGKITVAREDPTNCAHCGSEKITQDPDVFDTWFSSGLWPFATLGWPDDTIDLRAFYPTTLLVTGFDIIFFWAARMIMLGIEFMGEIPFRQVHIHGLVRDAERQKMSKTKGNTVDPLVINDQYGTDAVRFALLVSAAPGNDIALSEDRLASTRSFANKIWNASRLLFSKTPGDPVPVSLADRWIASRLNACAEVANRAFEHHRYHEAADALWHFFWDEFCDWYLELKKPDANWGFAYKVHEDALRLLHPLMPFITEELWHRRGNETSIALERYPQFDPAKTDPEAEREMGLLQGIVGAARALRADHKIDKKQPLTGVLYCAKPVQIDQIQRLANITLEVNTGPAPKLEGTVRSTPDFDLLLHISEPPAQKERLEKENEQLEKLIANSARQLENEDFLGKAPEKVIASIRQKKAEYEAQLSKNRAALTSA
ncbi:MAG: valine--tRNA ligase [Bryobacteraceae bacterium]|jgi:valyl-tRNA synthetase